MKSKFIVYWTKWDRTLPKWRAINKWERCSTLKKAERRKTELLKTPFIDAFIAESVK